MKEAPRALLSQEQLLCLKSAGGPEDEDCVKEHSIKAAFLAKQSGVDSFLQQREKLPGSPPKKPRMRSHLRSYRELTTQIHVHPGWEVHRTPRTVSLQLLIRAKLIAGLFFGTAYCTTSSQCVHAVQQKVLSVQFSDLKRSLFSVTSHKTTRRISNPASR